MAGFDMQLCSRRGFGVTAASRAISAGLFLLLAGCVYVPQPVTPRIEARVVDASTGAAIAGARVRIEASPGVAQAAADTMTAADGRFTLEMVKVKQWREALPASRMPSSGLLTIAADGYRTRNMVVLRNVEEAPAGDVFVLGSDEIALTPEDAEAGG